jgi:hypothetical protein
VVNPQDSQGDDLGERVFDFCAADTISDWARRNVACVCHVGAKLKILNDAGRADPLRFTARRRKIHVYRRYAVSPSYI